MQIRIKAKIYRSDEKFSDKHYRERSVEKNALAHSSKQSTPINSYESVVENFKKTLKLEDQISSRPKYWGGFDILPYYFEFWEGHNSRVNKRKFYELKNQEWKSGFLQP